MPTPFQKYLVLSFGYEDLVGISGSGGIKRVKKELEKYNLFAVLETCAKISIMLLSGGFTSSLTQVKLLAGIFPDKKQRIHFYETAKTKAGKLPWTIFNHQSLLTLVKLALLHCPKSKGYQVTSKNIEKLGYWCLIINDECFADESGKNVLLPSRQHDRERLRSALARYQFFHRAERLGYKIGRYRWIVDYFRLNKPHKIDIDDLFEKATGGISLHDYLTVCGSLLVKWVNLSKKEPDITKEWITCKKIYFSKTKIDPKIIDKVLSSMMMNPDEFTDHHQESLKILEGRDVLHYNFLPFVWKPLIAQPQTDCFVCPSAEYLFDKITGGIYREIETYLRRINSTKLRQTFSIAWGDAFEKYIACSLGNAFGKKFYPNPKGKDNKELIDGIIESDDFIFLIETKNHHWKYKAMVTGERKEMESSLKHLFAEKGLQQITNCIKKIKKGDEQLPVDINNKKIIPLLIVSNTMPQDAYNRKLYEDAVVQMRVAIFGEQVLPFVILTAEEVEMLEAIAENLSTERATAILSEYSQVYMRRTTEGFVPEAISFKNYLFYKGYEDSGKVSNNTRLLKLFDDVFDKVSKEAFGKKPWKRRGIK